MSTKEKLIKRLLSLPKDFTFNELKNLLCGLGFIMSNKGKTSGSRVRFQNSERKIVIDIHKPHNSGDSIRETTLKNIVNALIKSNLIK